MCRGIPSERISRTDADYLMGAASSGDCTGLMPAPPKDGDEWSSYLDIRSLMTGETSGVKRDRLR